MKNYIGTKQISAKPMSLGEYNNYRGWDLPADEDYAQEGYLVEYLDGIGKPNHKNHKGYITWTPDEPFEKAYRSSGDLSFGHAIELMKDGLKVARSGWNGKKMFLFLVQGSVFKVNRPPLNQFYPEGHEITYCPHIDMKTADDKVVPWLASQTDVLANDWCVVG